MAKPISLMEQMIKLQKQNQLLMKQMMLMMEDQGWGGSFIDDQMKEPKLENPNTVKAAVSSINTTEPSFFPLIFGRSIEKREEIVEEAVKEKVVEEEPLVKTSDSTVVEIVVEMKREGVDVSFVLVKKQPRIDHSPVFKVISMSTLIYAHEVFVQMPMRNETVAFGFVKFLFDPGIETKLGILIMGFEYLWKGANELEREFDIIGSEGESGIGLGFKFVFKDNLVETFWENKLMNRREPPSGEENSSYHFEVASCFDTFMSTLNYEIVQFARLKFLVCVDDYCVMTNSGEWLIAWVVNQSRTKTENCTLATRLVKGGVFVMVVGCCYVWVCADFCISKEENVKSFGWIIAWFDYQPTRREEDYTLGTRCVKGGCCCYGFLLFETWV